MKPLMVCFCEQPIGSAHVSKARALQWAQLDLLGTAAFEHPFFGAPFIPVGRWQ